jgi:recombination protein RecA
MSAVPSAVPAADPALLVRRAVEMAGVRVGRDGVLVVAASRMEERRTPITVATGIAALDELSGGIPRGALTEICGPASSGRTSVLLALMARMTRANEVCAHVDASDSFDPHSAEAAGVDLKRVLWVRCSNSPRRRGGLEKGIADCRLTIDDCKTSAQQNRQSSILNRQSSMSPCLHGDSYSRRKAEFSRVEQALKATDLLLQGGGFGLVVVDLAGIAPDAARRVPLTSWFRFRRTVENTATALVVLEQQPYAKTCASLVVQLSAVSAQLSVKRPTRQPTHAALFGGLEVHAEVTRDRQQRKPVQAVAAWDSVVPHICPVLADVG